MKDGRKKDREETAGEERGKEGRNGAEGQMKGREGKKVGK